jgi:serine/threonine-protein kinase
MGPVPAAEANPDLATEKVGTIIDRRYRITGLLGRGGMGSVYRAEHVRIRRPVAIKLLHPEYGAIEEIAKRFEREAFATGRLDHPNIVTISDFGELDDGTLFLVMELLDGVSLGDILEEEAPIEPTRALSIIKHVLRGLGAAHEGGVVHRDVKPENVLLVEHAGQPEFAKLLDFGIAKLLGEAEEAEGGEKLTQAGVAFGTPSYISPEQATGSTIDGRADIYAASVVLYEMLIGRPPFVADEKLKLLAMHATRPVPTFAEVAPDLELAPGLEELVRRGMAKEPDDRYPNCAAYMVAIDDYLATLAPEPTSALPVHGSSPDLAAGMTGSSPELAVSGRSESTIHTGMTTHGRSRKWIPIGLISAGLIFLILILANAAGSGDADPKAVSAALNKLAHGSSCEERREAVLELAALGDKRAIKPLEKARKKRGNGCLDKAAKQAIDKLE